MNKILVLNADFTIMTEPAFEAKYNMAPHRYRVALLKRNIPAEIDRVNRCMDDLNVQRIIGNISEEVFELVRKMFENRIKELELLKRIIYN